MHRGCSRASSTRSRRNSHLRTPFALGHTHLSLAAASITPFYICPVHHVHSVGYMQGRTVPSPLLLTGRQEEARVMECMEWKVRQAADEQVSTPRRCPAIYVEMKRLCTPCCLCPKCGGCAKGGYCTGPFVILFMEG